MHAYTHICMHICMHACMLIYVHACMHAYAVAQFGDVIIVFPDSKHSHVPSTIPLR